MIPNSTDIAICVRDVTKIFKFGRRKDGSLKGSIQSFFLGTLKNSEHFHALRNVSFELKKGEVLGIIGKNGAGKSTLLKILSQITKPSSGRIEINGRVASLLEVGTGFHPELTGRENIYLNGTILGMSRKEVKEKFDEIVAFSGVEKFIDTPVKHYSSGMYVRLAFAVAAHLEPEILIIDEVLAVGDAEFQKKCLGKMKEVAGHGRTVIFVSHNMEAVKSLCDRAIFLEHGDLVKEGHPVEIIEYYLQKQSGSLHHQEFTYEEAPGNEFVRLRSVKLIPKRADGKNIITVKSPLEIKMEYWNEKDGVATNLSLHLYAATGECVFNIITQLPVPVLNKGLHTASCLIPAELLNTGVFFLSVMVVKDTSIPLFNFEDILRFEIEEERENTNWHGKFPGFVRPNIDFRLHA
jgi:lipopolysaccharide transport system ATP-binding protein